MLRIVGDLPDDPFLAIKLLSTDHLIHWLPNDFYYVADQGGVVSTHEQVEWLIGRIRAFYERITPEEIERLNEDKKPQPPIFEGERPGVVYIFRQGDRYKIGFTRAEVEKRRHQVELAMRRQNMPGAVSIVHVIETDHPQELEARLHIYFARHNIEGEWFLLSEDDLARVIAFAEANR